MITGDKTVSIAASRLQRTVLKWVALSAAGVAGGDPTVPENGSNFTGTKPAELLRDLARLENAGRAHRQAGDLQ